MSAEEPIRQRIAAAPISWGVCEVPGWGFQMEPSEVLRQMQELGFAAAEFGPAGFLPEDPEQKAEILRAHGMAALGGFVPAVLHDPGHDPLPEVRRELEAYVAAGARTLVLAAATGVDGYDDPRPVLDEEGWRRLRENAERIVEAATEAGVSVALHPHAGTMVENQAELDRILEDTDLSICLDSGHMLVGGIDPVAFVRDHADRISHVHAKDVDLAWARRVQQGELSYYDAVVKGMYRPLGSGDLDLESILRNLEEAGYQGWFVLEQDTVLDQAPSEDGGPRNDVSASLEHLVRTVESIRSEARSS
ncbi:TIM barrel protein [Kocuria coralli]|uniref:TIM barrel protein n=1 Tax=Kocuria coralli TaxID=1461025 RepID=A0A5J5KXZ7_9MICC|nr:sugar phosphate isomerase/epimerase [Kocuria coralli]KAA9394298.1 TIM barrel protein [Kocuria coralli]